MFFTITTPCRAPEELCRSACSPQRPTPSPLKSPCTSTPPYRSFRSPPSALRACRRLPRRRRPCSKAARRWRRRRLTASLRRYGSERERERGSLSFRVLTSPPLVFPPRWQTRWWVSQNPASFPPRPKAARAQPPRASLRPASRCHPPQPSPAITAELRPTAPRKKRLAWRLRPLQKHASNPVVLFPSNRFLSPLQKQQIQEKAISEVKTAIKPFYQRKDITKEEYKEIVRKAVEKVNSAGSDTRNSTRPCPCFWPCVGGK